jgi:ArsR family metal-binding transcriptional regulator
LWSSTKTPTIISWEKVTTILLATATAQTTTKIARKTKFLLTSNTVTKQIDKTYHTPPAPNIIPRYLTHNKVTMISMTTRQSSAALKKIEELRLINKKKNDEARKLQEEEDKRKMDEAAEARRKHSEEKEQARVDLTPKNLNDILNGAEEGDPDGMERSAGGDTGS